VCAKRKLATYLTGEPVRRAGVQAQKVGHLRRLLLQQLRPNAISLVDAWAFTDYELSSAIGRADGDVYNALFDMAQGSPLNSSDEGPAWETVLKPAMMQLRKSKL
jgi:acyl-CoA oxidase